MNRLFVRNAFNTSHSRTALFCHLTQSLDTNNRQHVNRLEGLLTARVLSSLGFNIDLYNYRYKEDIDYSPYDLVYGLGRNLPRAYQQNRSHPLVIYYATGLPLCLFSYQAHRAMQYFYARHGVWLYESHRFPEGDVEETMSEQLCDALIVLGAESHALHQKLYPQKIVLAQNAPFNTRLDEKTILNKEYALAKKQYLWMGSIGLIYKGLDVVLDVFSKRPDLTLHILCLEKEPSFFEHYTEALRLPNIRRYGFIDVQSPLFQELVATCGFVLSSSWAEGQSTSVVNCMHCGLIPIVTRECGLSHDEVPILLEDQSMEALERALRICDAMDPSTMRELAGNVLKNTKQRHGPKAYMEQLRKNILEIFAAHRPQWLEAP